MPDHPAELIDEVIERSQELLSHRFGGTQRLLEPHLLSGEGDSIVLRARVAAQPFLQQRTVVLKYIPATGDALDDAALLREAAAYQFITALTEEHRPGPVLLAHDVDKRILITSDSGAAHTLADILDTASAEERLSAVRSLGFALGRMHVGTAGRESQFRVLLDRMLKGHPEAEQSKDLRDRSIGPAIAAGIDLITSAGIEVPESVRVAAQHASRQLYSSSHRAFTPFDLSPDNVIMARRLEFLDYEWAGYRDVSFDVACVVGGFPQYVGVHGLSDDEVNAFISSWRREVTDLWPELSDKEYVAERVSTALLGWALSSVAMMHYGNLTRVLITDAEATPEPTLLLPHDSADFSDEERVIRRDLYETFEALARYAGRGTGASRSDLAPLAAAVAARLEDR